MLAYIGVRDRIEENVYVDRLIKDFVESDKGELTKCFFMKHFFFFTSVKLGWIPYNSQYRDIYLMCECFPHTCLMMKAYHFKYLINR